MADAQGSTGLLNFAAFLADPAFRLAWDAFKRPGRLAFGKSTECLTLHAKKCPPQCIQVLSVPLDEPRGAASPDPALVETPSLRSASSDEKQFSDYISSL